MKRSVTVSVIVPALNEERNIRGAVSDLDAVLAGRASDYELLLFDDGSTDQTGAIMDELAKENPHVVVTHNPSPRNVGGVYKQGIRRARCDYVFYFPGDNENPAHTMVPLIEAIGTADVVLQYPTNSDRVRSRVRNVISRSYTRLLNRLFGLNLQYYNGTSIFRTRLLKQIDIRSNSFAYQAEVVVKMLKSRNNYVEVGILLGRAGSRTKMFRLKNVAGVLWDLGGLLRDVYLPL